MKPLRFVMLAQMATPAWPGKILAPLGGRCGLEWAVRRMEPAVERLASQADFVVATTRDAADDLVAHWAQSLEVACFRGDADPQRRVLEATADLDPATDVVLLSAEHPYYCARRTIRLLTEHLAEDLDASRVEGSCAVVPEVIRVRLLREAGYGGSIRLTPPDADPPIRRRVWPATSWGLRPEVRLALDEPADFVRLAAIADRLTAGHPWRDPADYSLDEVYACYDHWRKYASQSIGLPRRAA